MRRSAVVLASALALLVGATPAPARAAGVPVIGAVWSTEVVATSARLHAEVDPEGMPTTYRFDYLTEAAYQANLAAGHEGFVGAARAPAGAEASAGSGSALAPVFQTVAGLTPATPYRYRVVARNGEGTVPGEPHTFVTQSLGGASPLLDGRGWEMVSPPEKNGGQVGAPEAIYGGGDLQAAAGGGAATFSSFASFGEEAAGAPPASQYLATRTASGWVTRNVTPLTLAGSYGDRPDGVPYRLFSADLSRSLMLDGSRCAAGEECPRSYSLRGGEGAEIAVSPAASGLTVAGATPSLGHVVLSTCVALTAEAAEEPEGEGCDPVDTNLYEWSGGGLTLINASRGEILPAPFGRLAAPSGAISEDGARVYWYQLEDGPIWLYEAGEPQRALPGTTGGAASLQIASSDGAYAFYTVGGALYRYDAVSGSSVEIATEVKGVLGASADGAVVYYQAAGGLYRWDDGTATEVATGAEAAEAGSWPPATGTARVTADGSAIAFLSTERLTGYDNTDQNTSLPDSELFLWKDGAGLTCVSCNPTNERPIGPASMPGAIANGSTRIYKPRDLVAGGRRLFFDTADALVLSDTNDAPDVYEWEADGAGSCGAPAGCLGLVSSGKAEGGATFADASESGGDAYFLTSQSLVASDPGSTDLYDAREGGGFPEAAKPIACEGDACQSLPSEPEDPQPGTLLSGLGNPLLRTPAVRCPKGKRRVKKHGKVRCVASHKRHPRGKHHRRRDPDRKGGR